MSTDYDFNDPTTYDVFVANYPISRAACDQNGSKHLARLNVFTAESILRGLELRPANTHLEPVD
jgi:hypothetical protein